MSTREIGRNDPCPCGSGVKYKRCCLLRRDMLTRETARLAAAVETLGRWARAEQREAYLARFAEFYRLGWEAFGLQGPDRDERLTAELWLTCDAALDDRATALERVGPALLPDDVVAALTASTLRAWRVGAVRGAGIVDARCLARADRVILDLAEPPLGELEPGAIVVGRAISPEPGRCAPIGRATVVDPDAHADFEELFCRLCADEPDTARLWREHGGRLASAALAWPEEREHTREGELVRETHVAFEVPDVAAMSAALDAAPEFERAGQDFWDSDTTAWNWRAGRVESSPAAMPDELGVQWLLCDEDCETPPIDAKLELDLDEYSLWLYAPAARRLARCERAFTERFGDLLGEPTHRGTDLVETTPRWRRERWERTLPQLGRALKRARELAA